MASSMKIPNNEQMCSLLNPFHNGVPPIAKLLSTEIFFWQNGTFNK